jgi:hypothetical protein
MLILAEAPNISFGGVVFDIRLTLEVLAAGLAIRAYRHKPTKPLCLLRFGFLCLAVTDVAMFAFGVIAGFAFTELRRIRWIYYGDPLALITLLACAIMSFESVIGERRVAPQTSNQALQPRFAS